MQKIGAFLVLFGSLGAVFGGSDGGCMKDFKNLKEMDAAVEKCKTKLNLKESDMQQMMPADLAKNGFDDKCMIKCVMVEMKYAKEDGTVDMKALEEDLKKNAPAGKADALVALMRECAETTAKDAAIMKDPCKSIAKTKMCYVMGQDKICPPA
ncbi:uncharacterized protein LOC110849219 [Folsomia candida]|uniref:uncharacterized protein LOC110849219 n=1 Tax=Folsomia candida TaxID=158441 RepID=UPI000B9021E0|nr:uncharacterized protein LOC110849219 [Folsomia candida]